jgi:hypothetical protein
MSVALENPEWTRRCIVVITPDLLFRNFSGWPTRSPKVVLHGRVLILTAERNVYQYDMHTNMIDKIASARSYQKTRFDISLIMLRVWYVSINFDMLLFSLYFEAK